MPDSAYPAIPSALILNFIPGIFFRIRYDFGPDSNDVPENRFLYDLDFFETPVTVTP